MQWLKRLFRLEESPEAPVIAEPEPVPAGPSPEQIYQEAQDRIHARAAELLAEHTAYQQHLSRECLLHPNEVLALEREARERADQELHGADWGHR